MWTIVVLIGVSRRDHRRGQPVIFRRPLHIVVMGDVIDRARDDAHGGAHWTHCERQRQDEPPHSLSITWSNAPSQGAGKAGVDDFSATNADTGIRKDDCHR